MCARYSLTKEQITMLIGEIEVIINIGARYNIAPTQIVPAIVRSARGIEMVDMQWGFKSAWSKQPLINAKAETIATTAFKQHLHHRCLIPADGFYEWTADRTPSRTSAWHFSPSDAEKELFCGTISRRRCLRTNTGLISVTPSAYLNLRSRIWRGSRLIQVGQLLSMCGVKTKAKF